MASHSFVSAMSCLVVILVVAAVATADQTQREDRTVVVHRPDPLQRGWAMKRDEPPHPDHPITFFVGLRTGKEGLTEQLALEVSNPKSRRFRKFLTRDEIWALIAPPTEVAKEVVSWLRKDSDPAEPLTWEDRADHIMVTTTVRNVETLFQTSMATFQRSDFTTRVAITRSATMPRQIAERVSHVHGLDNFKPMFKFTAHRSLLAERDPSTTPSLLRLLYNVSSALVAQTTLNQGVVAFNDYYLQQALEEFASAYDQSNPSVTNVGDSSCLPYCDETESDLDVQYMTAMGNGVPTLFDANNNQNADFYYWASSVASNQVATAYVYSISYGAPDVESTWTSEESLLAQLALRGITVIAASGDTGAPGLDTYPPVNTAQWCPFDDCASSGEVAPQCAQFNYILSDVIYPFPSALYSDHLTTYLNLSQSFNNFASSQSSSCQASIEVGSKTGIFNFYSACPCSSLSYSYVDAATGMSFVQYSEANNNEDGYYLINPSYPASSAYVTAVGATEYTGSVEVVASILGTGFTSGGGFSYSISQPEWQSSAVTSYLSSQSSAIPPSSVVVYDGRASPDVAFLGNNFQIYTTLSTGNVGPSTVGGTSASSPSFAGLIALINDARKQRQLSTLGFLNPTLYSLAKSNPQVFNDITSGSNYGTETFIGLYGYPAATGWDPVTGLGTINFGPLFDQLSNDVLATPSPGLYSPNPGPSSGSSGPRLQGLHHLITELFLK